MPAEPDSYQFKNICLAATVPTGKSKIGHLVLLVINNRQPPYPFIDCVSVADY